MAKKPPRRERKRRKLERERQQRIQTADTRDDARQADSVLTTPDEETAIRELNDMLPETCRVDPRHARRDVSLLMKYMGGGAFTDDEMKAIMRHAGAIMVSTNKDSTKLACIRSFQRNAQIEIKRQAEERKMMELDLRERELAANNPQNVSSKHIHFHGPNALPAHAESLEARKQRILEKLRAS